MNVFAQIVFQKIVIPTLREVASLKDKRTCRISGYGSTNKSCQAEFGEQLRPKLRTK